MLFRLNLRLPLHCMKVFSYECVFSVCHFLWRNDIYLIIALQAALEYYQATVLEGAGRCLLFRLIPVLPREARALGK